MAGEPLIHRKFQLADLADNHNKSWAIRLFPGAEGETEWGRVGEQTQTAHYHGVDESWVSTKISEKIRKGYVELRLGKTQVVITASQGVPARVDQLVEWIFSEAGEKIAQSLATTVDALSVEQIALGRRLLQEWVDHKRFPPAILQEYYNAIPTKLPRKIDIVELSREFNPSDEEDRLNQLEAALSTYQVTSTGISQYGALGVEIEEITEGKTYAFIKHYMETTGQYEWRVLDGIFKVRIPHERQRYDAEEFGKETVAALWHGSKTPNIRHILKSGFRIPDVHANGSMFGAAVYQADQAGKSIRYIPPGKDGKKLLFLCDTKLGKSYVAPEAHYYREPPSGYHSVMGKKGYTKSSVWPTLLNNEFMIYRPSQTTIRYLVTFR